MSETPTPETDAARLCGYGYFSGVWVSVERNCYKKDPEGDVVFCEVAEKLERERDDALKDKEKLERERNAAREELALVRRELVASNRGAETNAKVNQGLCAKLADAERERDEARRELVIQRHELMRGQKEVIETLIKLRERLAEATHPNKSDQKEEA